MHQRGQIESALETFPLLADLSESERSKLADALELVTFEDNDRIIRQVHPLYVSPTAATCVLLC